MRLTAEQRAIIREEVVNAFGPEATVRLFGSRLDDGKRGGDIDLHIEAAGSADELLDRELALHGRLQRRLGERRVDLVVLSDGSPKRSIDTEAIRTGVAL